MVITETIIKSGSQEQIIFTPAYENGKLIYAGIKIKTATDDPDDMVLMGPSDLRQIRDYLITLLK